MIYMLETTTKAKFDNMKDASTYHARLIEDEPDANVNEPRHDPSSGLIVVKLTKHETVQICKL